MPPRADTARWTIALVAALMLGASLRLVELGRLPGVNGDESWYGVNVEAYLAGQPVFLHTGVGNPLNPLHSVPLLALSSIASPSMALLRLPSAIWGIVSIVLAYVLLRRDLGSRAAAMAAMLLTVSPVAVAYSRFGWDPSDTPAITLLALAFAIRGQAVMTVICSGLSLIVHPTNIFALPIVAALWLPHALRQYRSSAADSRFRFAIVGAISVAAAIAVGVAILFRAAGNPDTLLPSVDVALTRLISVGGWIDRIAGVFAFFSGVTTAQFIVGSVPPVWRTVATVSAVLAFAIPIAAGWQRFVTSRDALGPRLFGGILASLLTFHIITGAHTLQPGFERYGLFLLVPLALLCAVGFDAWAESRTVALTTFGAGCAALLGVLIVFYFVPLVVRGGSSEPTFRTGPIEPKVAAHDFIARDSATATAVRVTAQEWFMYWSLRYLAARDARIHVELPAGAAAPGGVRPAGAPPPSYPRPAVEYFVGWEGTAPVPDAPAYTAFDPMGRPILHVWRRASP